VYGSADFVRLEADVDALVARGADGIVFGVLTADGRVDAMQVRAIVDRCAGLETVFHRAFDETQNAAEALDTLIECGVTRVLTSGGAPTAIEGAGTIAMLVTRARGRIQVLPGGGVRAANVAELATATGVKQVHARASEPGVIAGIRAALG
jgi:copper homeostasis protein